MDSGDELRTVGKGLAPSRRIVVQGLTREWIFQALRPVARGIRCTFGDLCEVVIHDFSNPEHSIVWIEGDVTKRKIGGSVTEIGLALLRGGDDQEDLIGYTHNTKDGKVLRSSTILLRDPKGHVLGCLCINFDITEFLGFKKTMSRFAPEIADAPLPVKFTDQIDEVLGRILEEVRVEQPTPVQLMSREERLSLISALDRRGAFQVQRGVPTIARFLSVSRTTVYKYLETVRANGRKSDQGLRSG
jgi:predicted transcriptional regulator YheO